MMNAYVNAFRRAFDFSGRSTRSEFWMFVLVGTVAMVTASLLDTLLLGRASGLSLASLVGLVQLVPSISITIRRLHDTGRSGRWYLIAFVPLVGAIFLLVMLCGKSVPAGYRRGTGRVRLQRGADALVPSAAGGAGLMLSEAVDLAGDAVGAFDLADGPDDGPDMDFDSD